MAEGLTKRVGRIISGGINAIVDAVEDANPSVVMEQAIREIDSAIDDVRIELGKVIAGKHLATKRLTEKNTQHKKFTEQIEIAVQQRRDDLAEAAISAQLDIEAQTPLLEQTIAQAGEHEKELDGYIVALQAQKREMQDTLRAYQQQLIAQQGHTTDGQTQGSSIDKKVNQASAVFDRVLHRQTGVPGLAPTDKTHASQLAELEALTRQNRIKERLALLKSTSN